MKCGTCGDHAVLDFKYTEVDTTYKDYLCLNGHKTTIKRYGYNIEFCGKVVKSWLWYHPCDLRQDALTLNQN